MESALYGIYALVFVSEILLVRFLIRQQLVRKYRTPALSMKYSLHTTKGINHTKANDAYMIFQRITLLLVSQATSKVRKCFLNL